MTAATKSPWFKRNDDARALAEYLAAHGLPPAMRQVVDVFWERVRDGLGASRNEDDVRETG